MAKNEADANDRPPSRGDTLDTKSSKTEGADRAQGEMAAKPQTEHLHPAEWESDLNPAHMAGQNIGETSTERELGLQTAYDYREIHISLRGFQDDELRQIPIVPPGERLQQGATYLDLRDPDREEFTAMGGMSAGDESWIVPKDVVPYTIWNRLRGIDDPERTGENAPRDDRG